MEMDERPISSLGSCFDPLVEVDRNCCDLLCGGSSPPWLEPSLWTLPRLERHRGDDALHGQSWGPITDGKTPKKDSISSRCRDLVHHRLGSKHSSQWRRDLDRGRHDRQFISRWRQRLRSTLFDCTISITLIPSVDLLGIDQFGIDL